MAPSNQNLSFPTNANASPGLAHGAPDGRPVSSFHQASRALHWLMAVGFLFMWLTGVLVTNVEGVPYFVEADLQGVIRDLHKSVGLTLLGLLILRAALRFIYPAPPLPAAIPPRERKWAHAGHLALYAAVVAACVTGYAIADLQDYGNAYFGIDLPAIFPVREVVAGWSVAPWSYVLHAVLAYGLLAMVIGHVFFVVLHTRRHSTRLLTRMLKYPGRDADGLLQKIVIGAGLAALVVVAFALRGFMTLGPSEEPRDYVSTTPFSR